MSNVVHYNVLQIIASLPACDICDKQPNSRNDIRQMEQNWEAEDDESFDDSHLGMILWKHGLTRLQNQVFESTFHWPQNLFEVEFFILSCLWKVHEGINSLDVDKFINISFYSNFQYILCILKFIFTPWECNHMQITLLKVYARMIRSKKDRF